MLMVRHMACLVFTFLYFIACETQNKMVSPTETDSVPELEGHSDSGLDTVQPMSAFEFANICKRELGLPDDPLPPMRCTDGIEIPIFVHGELPDLERYEQLSNGDIGCDNPSWINSEEPCANYSFVTRYELSESVTAMLFCRKKNFSSPLDYDGRLEAYVQEPTQSHFEDLFYFDTVGLIWSNHQTGKSCFFDNQYPNFYAGLIPSPDDPNPLSVEQFPEPKPSEEELERLLQGNALDIWRLPIYTKLHARCYRCHDADPFVRSPHLSALGILPPHQPNRPHQMLLPDVGTNITLAETHAIQTAPVMTSNGEEPQLCTQCHNIGSKHSCSEFINYYTGSLAPNQNESLSPHELILMPPLTEDQTIMSGEEYTSDWTQRVKPHLDKLKCCCDNPNAIGCMVRDLRYDELTPSTLGQGPETCE